MDPVNALKRWNELEPVRLYLYGVVLAGIALAVTLSLLTAEEALAWGAFGAAVLGVPAVEVARSKVTPVSGSVRSPHEEPRPALLADEDGKALLRQAVHGRRAP